MSDPLPGTSKNELSDMDDDEFESEMIVIPESSCEKTDLTTIVPVRRSSLAFLDPYFGFLLKENPLGINGCFTEHHCLSVIESDFAALVLSGDKQIVRNGRIVKSFKVSAGNKHHQIVLKTSNAHQKREINYLSQISKKFSTYKKVKDIANARSSSQKAILKQSLLNFVMNNEWFAPQKQVLNLLSDTQNVEEDEHEMVKWTDVKSCGKGNVFSSKDLEKPVSDVITTAGFRKLVRSSLLKKKSSEKLNVPVMLQTCSNQTASNIFWKATAVKSFEQTKGALQQTCSEADDITMNDLAGYFDNLVHIPKEMSSMAEMMYQ